MLKKKFLKTKCKVTFELPETAPGIQEVYLVGDFNDWDGHAMMMQNKGGRFTATLDLALNQEYQYRYLLNGGLWHTDEAADSHVANPFGENNAVVSTFPAGASER